MVFIIYLIEYINNLCNCNMYIAGKTQVNVTEVLIEVLLVMTKMLVFLLRKYEFLVISKYCLLKSLLF